MTEALARTHPGRRRSTNEDACFVDTRLNLFIVADGMGGHNAGEVASQLGLNVVVDFVRESKEDHSITWPFGIERDQTIQGNQLQNAVQLANERVYHQARKNRDHEGMGAAMVAVLCDGHQAAYVNVGDTRLYLFRRGRLEQLSLDQSWGASMLRAGASLDAVRAHPMRHALTSALGSEATLRPRVDTVTFENDDVLLLCSDGVHGPVPDDRLTAILTKADARLDATANALIDAANAAGGPDNATVVLVRFRDGDGSRS